MKTKTMEAIKDAQAEMMKLAEEAGLDVGTDTYMMVKQFGENQALVVEVTYDEDNKRTLKTHCLDTFFLGEKSEDTLDIYTTRRTENELL